MWAAFEQRVFRGQPAVERKALELWETDQTAARTYLTRYCADLAAEAGQEAEKLSRAFRGEDRP